MVFLLQSWTLWRFIRCAHLTLYIVMVLAISNFLIKHVLITSLECLDMFRLFLLIKSNFIVAVCV